MNPGYDLDVIVGRVGLRLDGIRRGAARSRREPSDRGESGKHATLLEASTAVISCADGHTSALTCAGELRPGSQLQAGDTLRKKRLTKGSESVWIGYPPHPAGDNLNLRRGGRVDRVDPMDCACRGCAGRQVAGRRSSRRLQRRNVPQARAGARVLATAPARRLSGCDASRSWHRSSLRSASKAAARATPRTKRRSPPRLRRPPRPRRPAQRRERRSRRWTSSISSTAGRAASRTPSRRRSYSPPSIARGSAGGGGCRVPV